MSIYLVVAVGVEPTPRRADYGFTDRASLCRYLAHNQCLVHVEGFEPTQPGVTGLQSASALQL